MAIDPTTIGLGIGQGLLGLALTDYNDQRQLQQQQKLTDMQKKANMELADYDQSLALDSWNKTNYEAQRKHMERAGLSVGMMYKGGGPGGQAIAGTAQGVSGAQAPTGGRELERIMDVMGIALLKNSNILEELPGLSPARDFFRFLFF